MSKTIDLCKSIFRSTSIKRQSSSPIEKRIASAETALTALEASISRTSLSSPTMTASEESASSSSLASTATAISASDDTTADELLQIIALVRSLLERLKKDRQASRQSTSIAPPTATPPPLVIVARENYPRRLAHIELMIHLLQTRDRRSPDFWRDIAAWQQATYQEGCHRLHLNVNKWADPSAVAAAQRPEEVAALKAAFKSASTSAYAEPKIYDARIAQAFQVRNMFDSDAMRAVKPAEKTSSVLNDMETMVIMEQPVFPNWCYTLLETGR